MPTYRYPVLIWPDASDASTAALVGDYEDAAAHAATAEEALRQLKELLEWRVENEPWGVEPDVTEPAFLEVKVEVRPQYSEGKRLIPCPETVWLRVPCVTGLQENGLPICVVPHLGLSFNYQDVGALKGLVGHYVKEALQQQSPVQLAGRLPPRGCRLTEIVLRATTGRVRRVPPADRPELKILFAVADPLLHDHGRRTASAAYGRDALSSALAHKLGHEKASVLLVGEPGAGKSTVLLDAAKKLARAKPSGGGADDEETDLRSYRFWRGSGGRMIAGMRYLGEWEERCEAFLQQLGAIEGVFCAENLLDLVQVGGQGPGDSVGAFLLPYLQRGELRMAAEATPAEVEACRRLLPGLLDVFQVVNVPAFDDAQSVAVLTRIATAHAAAARLEVAPVVATLTHRLFKRFQPYAAFPGPAATFVRSLCDRRGNTPLTLPSPLGEERVAEGRVRGIPERPGQRTVTAPDVIAQFIKRTGLPEVFLRDDLPLSVDAVRAQFAARVIGQPEATSAAARLVTTIKAGLTDPARPPGVLLFCGPTGVGKTALARALSEFCFGASGQKDRFVRLDMSEYGGHDAARRLLRNPQRGPAAWIERVRRQPFCVVLFDEIEKASPEVFDALLGLLDEGRLTDEFGRVTYFRSAIIVLTSNLGSTSPAGIGFAGEGGPAYESEVAKFFRPEFFNRLDAVVTFKSLTLPEVEAITRKELTELATREGFALSGIKLAWTDRLVSLIAREGYDHRLGARPLQRAIERMVVAPLARWKAAHPRLRALTVHLEIAEDGAVLVSPAPAVTR